MPSRPPFESLPLREGDPPFSAWGLYGADDQIGALNLLTSENTLAAAQSEIRTGVRVALDPPLDVLRLPSGGRKSLTQTIIRLAGRSSVHDDVLEFNTQVRIPLTYNLCHTRASDSLADRTFFIEIGGQWDGFRHMTYHKFGGRFYNNTPWEDISGKSARPDALGIHCE